MLSQQWMKKLSFQVRSPRLLDRDKDPDSRAGPTPSPIIVDRNTVDPVEKITYLCSTQSSYSNFEPEYIRRIELAAIAVKRLDCIWSQSKTMVVQTIGVRRLRDERLLSSDVLTTHVYIR